LVPTPTGQQWEIDAATLHIQGNDGDDANDTDDTTPTTQTTGTTNPTTATTPATTTGTTATTTANDTGDRNDTGLSSRYVAQLETENKFLRGVVEQQQRDAAELRAALREALRAMPKALLPSGQAPQAVQEATQSAGTITTATSTGQQARTAQQGTTRKIRPLWMVILGIRPKDG
jgi:hypothetical protein